MITATAQQMWRSQRDALEDLTKFIDEHGPDSTSPLPLLHWRVGPSPMVRAEIHALDREHGGGHRDPRAVIAAYADVLGTRIVEHGYEEDALLMVVRRIGPAQGDDAAGRTHIVISTRVPGGTRGKAGGSAFVP